MTIEATKLPSCLVRGAFVLYVIFHSCGSLVTSSPRSVQLLTFPGANSSAVSSLPSVQSSFPSQSSAIKMHRSLSPHLT